MSAPTLTTGRLVLRALREADAPVVQRLLSTPHFAPHTMSFPYPYPPGAALEWIRHKLSPETAAVNHQWAITLHGEEIVGSIGISLLPDMAAGHIGYWIGHNHWDRGYATESTRAVITYGFAELGLTRIEAMCFPDNPASSRVLEKAGLVFEELREAHILKDGQLRDVLLYAISPPTPGDPVG